uniref:Uncharacterized protein n=2 Tax=Anguilla anguilla TaxID=7936 RepID=A0A0E9R6L2_ANGAN
MRQVICKIEIDSPLNSQSKPSAMVCLSCQGQAINHKPSSNNMYQTVALKPVL